MRMIGRRQEFATLLGALDRATQGRGGVALVSGEAGIGKTTLAGEIRAAALERRIRVLWGRTPEATWASPYAPWVDAFGPLHDNPNALFAVDDTRTPEDRQIQIHDRVLALLRSTLAAGPLLIVLDDVHWAAAPALELLRHVAYEFSRAPVLLIATYRPSAAAANQPLGRCVGQLLRESNVIEIHLSGLDRDHLAALLGEIPDAHLDRILAETHGNPFFAIELARHPAVIADGTDGSERHRQVPLSVRRAIGHRLDGLSETARQTIQLGAIFSDSFDSRTIADLGQIPEPDIIDALDEATLAGFIEPGTGLDTYRFVHAIVRHSLLAEWQPARLVRDRRRAAEHLASNTWSHDPGEIATLYHASRSLPGADAGIDFALEAADRAQMAASHRQTATFLAMARDLCAAEDPRRVEILRRLAIAYAESLDIELAVETAWQAIDAMTADDAHSDDLADACAAIAVALKHRAGAAADQWRPIVQQGLQQVTGERGVGWARLSFLIDPVEPVSQSGIRAGRWTGYDPIAIAIARTRGSEEDRARSYESFDARNRAETDALIGLARSVRRPAARLHLMTVAANDLQYRHGAFHDARRLWDEIGVLAERHGAVAWQAQALDQRSLVEVALGEFVAAQASEDQANILLRRLGPGRQPELFAMEMATARTLYRGGDAARLAEFWLAFADDPALAAGDVATLMGPCFAAVGIVTATDAGMHDTARSMLALLTPLLERLPIDAPNLNGAVAFGAWAVWNLRDRQHSAPYRRLLQRMSEAGIRDYPQTSLHLGQAWMAALLDRREEAEHAFDRARNTLERSGQRPLQAIGDYDRAAWLLESGSGDLGRASSLAAAAKTAFDRLDMPVWSQRADTLIDRIAGATAPASYPAGLTEREVEVLLLAVQGHSDKEISDRLFISPRTVNAHMRNMFAKTGAANRTELSVWAVAQGLTAR